MTETNMAGVVLQLRHSNTQFKQVGSDFYLAGSAFLGERLLSAAQLKNEVQHAIAEQRLTELLTRLNGFYTIISLSADGCYLIADKLRSWPLFYAVRAGSLVVSDVAEALIEHSVLNPIAAEEFLATGFVTGSDTLIDGVSQLQSAEYLNWHSASERIEQYCYDLFLPKNEDLGNISDAQLSAQMQSWYPALDQALMDATQRLIQYANGRQIVLPLSGGYDSRAIALYLHKLGYPNVCCFTFGRKGSPEVELSQQIANSLGFEWHCVTYTAAMWRQLMQDSEFKCYLEFIHNFVSVPNVQVYPAVKLLRLQQKIAADAVLVPGHTGDFVSGGHMPPPNNHNMPALDYLHQVVSCRHYAFSRVTLSVALQHKLNTQLSGYIKEAGSVNPISIAEAWNYRERQAKFIVNSNRYYDYFQLDWWMPLWDNSIMLFWQQVPYQMRLHKRLWIAWVEELAQQQIKSNKPLGNAEQILLKRNAYLQRYLNYFSDNNHLHAIVPFSRWLFAKIRLSKKPGTVFGYLASISLANSATKLRK